MWRLHKFIWKITYLEKNKQKNISETPLFGILVKRGKNLFCFLRRKNGCVACLKTLGEILT